MIQVENTPNPESLKFLSEKIISASGTEEFQKNDINRLMIDLGLLANNAFRSADPKSGG